MEMNQNITDDVVKCATDRAADPGIFPACKAGKSEYTASERSSRGGVDFPVSVVLPAGGTGERTGLRTPKQFCTFLGRPLISYTIHAFERVSWIQRIMVVVAKENTELMTDIIQRYQHTKVQTVPGGSTRHRSICNGVLALGEDGEDKRPEVVIIHDAVRPFVEEDFLYKIVMTAKEQGCSESDLEFGTECLHLALQYCGTNAKLIEGPPTLWKVTYKRDLAAAEFIIKETLSQSACVITGPSLHAVTLAGALWKAFGTFGMELDVVPDLLGNNSNFLLKENNFIQLSVNSSLSEVEAILWALESSRVLLNSVVVIWVHLRGLDGLAISGTMTEPAPLIMELASAAKPRNVLLFGIQLHQPNDLEQWERSALRVAEITSALIRERNPALVGQLLQA
ncbi:D-ribitol-5-phosphate cytidylyltransferase isoform X2 [Sphaeramia orbicularis]|uniref:D-ribitol-5-phosphate cytidylyltransferase isoform X2 n=1 Tax=Sphaeramia orbicularis TaxID=375764 RepID=UPI0011816AED|nr:D-ribitol-5-phosphate cytidylyltransferase isoform X2 [Sphaeramia orbicularis]